MIMCLRTLALHAYDKVSIVSNYFRKFIELALSAIDAGDWGTGWKCLFHTVSLKTWNWQDNMKLICPSPKWKGCHLLHKLSHVLAPRLRTSHCTCEQALQLNTDGCLWWSRWHNVYSWKFGSWDADLWQNSVCGYGKICNEKVWLVERFNSWKDSWKD